MNFAALLLITTALRTDIEIEGAESSGIRDHIPNTVHEIINALKTFSQQIIDRGFQRVKLGIYSLWIRTQENKYQRNMRLIEDADSEITTTTEIISDDIECQNYITFILLWLQSCVLLYLLIIVILVLHFKRLGRRPIDVEAEDGKDIKENPKLEDSVDDENQTVRASNIYCELNQDSGKSQTEILEDKNWGSCSIQILQ
ncbi:hypothetical protein ACOME3_004790 [Neoechinorhynchus agilis]